MADQQDDYSVVYDFIYRIERRISSLEKDAKFIEGYIGNLENRKISHFQSLSGELTQLKGQIGAIKTNFNNCVKHMIILSKDMRESVKKEDVETINSTIDDIKFEEYVTLKDLSRGV